MRIELERRECTRIALRLSGRLRPGWCGNLSTGLAGLGVDVVRGEAVSRGAGLWTAEFELRCEAGREPSADDLGEMLESAASPGFAAPLSLRGYRLARSGSHGGCLLLEVEAHDRVGFLAALLRRLAYFALFPVELRLDTVGRSARDRLWLRGGGDRLPSAGTEKALAASLAALLPRTATTRSPAPGA